MGKIEIAHFVFIDNGTVYCASQDNGKYHVHLKVDQLGTQFIKC